VVILTLKKEAAWALANATSGGSPEQIRYFVSENVIEPLCDLLDGPDPRIVLVALEGLENILKVGEKESKELGFNPYGHMVEECFGLDKLESLQNHKNDDIYEKVVNILELYFAAEEEEVSTISPPVTCGTSTGNRGGKNNGVHVGAYPFHFKFGNTLTGVPEFELPVAFNF